MQKHGVLMRLPLLPLLKGVLLHSDVAVWLCGCVALRWGDSPDAIAGLTVVRDAIAGLTFQSDRSSDQ